MLDMLSYFVAFSYTNYTKPKLGDIKHEVVTMGASLIMFYCRGSRLHYGIDISCDAGSSVYSPFPAQVTRISRPYGNGKPHDTGIYMKGTGAWIGK